MSDRAALLERIRKLRARATADRGPEGRTAGRLARELMHDNGITAAELNPPKPSRSTRATPTITPRPRARRAPLPVSVDLDLGGIRIRWSGKL